MKKIIVILGTPCSGKSTHAKLLSKKLNYKYFSSGEFILEEIKNETGFGLIAKKYFDMKVSIPDEYLIRAVKEQIINLKEDGIIFNGYPKTLSQAKALDAFLFVRKTNEPIAIFLYAETIATRNRISEKSNNVDDGNVFKAIMNNFELKTRSVVDYYINKHGFDTSINDIEKINEEILIKIQKNVN